MEYCGLEKREKMKNRDKERKNNKISAEVVNSGLVEKIIINKSSEAKR